jgi:hypothetical protein
MVSGVAAVIVRGLAPGWILLGELMSGAILAGGALVMTGMVIAWSAQRRADSILSPSGDLLCRHGTALFVSLSGLSF